mgnify:CR=1 FL=1
MSRQTKTLISNAAAPVTGEWFETGGYVHSIDAALAVGATAAVIELYGSNSGDGNGVLLATIPLSAATPSDGASIPDYAKGWMMIRAKLVSTTGGIKSASACVGRS